MNYNISDQRIKEIGDIILYSEFPMCAILDSGKIIGQLGIYKSDEKQLIIDVVNIVNSKIN
jgi:predicted ATP-grasp superfamily ATP-dependent carboligase